jgi:hypothetical protein
MSGDECLLQATHNFYCAGFIIRDDRVVEAAPVLARKILFLPAAAAIKVLVNSGAVVTTIP